MTYSADPSRRHAYRRQQRLHPRDRPGTLALEVLEFPRQPPHALGGFSRQANEGRVWRDILCIQEERVVGDDNTVTWKRLSLQITASPLRPLSSAARSACTNTRTKPSPSASDRSGWGRLRRQRHLVTEHALAA
jgi:hypothetical protein